MDFSNQDSAEPMDIDDINFSTNSNNMNFRFPKFGFLNTPQPQNWGRFTTDDDSTTRRLEFARPYLSSIGLGKSARKQADVSLILAKHVFFSKIVKCGDFETKNMVFSPLSIQIALALIAAGTKGPALNQFLWFFDVNSIDELNTFYSRFITDVLADGSSLGGPRFSVANAVWIDKTLSFKPLFKHVADNFYRAALKSVDFQKKANEVAKEVNQWAEEETNGLIKNFLPHGAVNEQTKHILANALYFKGEWDHEYFNASETKEHDFYLLSGRTIRAPFMTTKKWQYVRAFNGFKVLSLPYKQGSDPRRLCMYIILPDDYNGLPALLEKISSEPEFLRHHKPHEKVEVAKFLVPKFKITFDFLASDVLKEAGLELPIRADEIVDNCPMFASQIIHKAFIQVNEEGTEAAAVTATVMFGAGARPIKEKIIIDFVADHPFLFAVKDDATGVVLFTGTVLNPLV